MDIVCCFLWVGRLKFGIELVFRLILVIELKKIGR